MVGTEEAEGPGEATATERADGAIPKERSRGEHGGKARERMGEGRLPVEWPRAVP